MQKEDTQEIESLVVAVRGGKAAAWDRLLELHELPLYSYVAELTGDGEQALDIVQETFSGAVRHIGGLREAGRFSSWLFGIAHQKCVQHFRKAKLREERFEEASEGVDEYLDDTVEDPCTRLMKAEQAQEFFGLLETLPAVQKSVLLLHVVEDFSLEEIAGITSVPVGTVKSRLHHAKRAMRLKLEESR